MAVATKEVIYTSAQGRMLDRGVKVTRYEGSFSLNLGVTRKDRPKAWAGVELFPPDIRSLIGVLERELEIMEPIYDEWKEAHGTDTGTH